MLLVGVLVGQMNIPISEPVKSVFFLMFLFAIGYKVCPQFFRCLKKDGLPQVFFSIVMCVACLLVTWGLAAIMGYGPGEAAGLLSGAQTISAVIAARCMVAVLPWMGVSLTPEYAFRIHETDGYEALRSVSSKVDKWSKGFNIKVGVTFFY